ncbi:LysM peptidoglycan-binding domain-containing protein [Rothia sp. P13129]|uniref:LysM peptidoglycan-binding domain-containing protein n=2 Tax=unclassified Rothia (in: high G+C Gram-positive bacteria) TaxID=2689056 RepID=UPI003AC52A43
MYQTSMLGKAQVSCSRTDYLLSVGTPLLAICTIFGSRLALTTTKPTHLDYVYVQFVLCLSGLVLLWWCTSIFFILRSYRFQQRNPHRRLHLPSWAPTCLKNCALALIGIGVICTPAQAYSPTQTATAITCVGQGQVENIESKPMSPPLTTFFTSKISQHDSAEKRSSGYEAKNSSLHHIMLSASEKEYIPLTPLFGVTTSTRSVHTKAPAKDHVVQAGDTLWNIAQTHLGEDATPSSILEYSYQIYQHNQELLRAYEAPIYPGEKLTLPNT